MSSNTRDVWIWWGLITACLVGIVLITLGCDSKGDGQGGEKPGWDALRNGTGRLSTGTLGATGTRARPGPSGELARPAPTHPGAIYSRSTAPRAVLREIHWAQEEFRRNAYVDEDHDGRGEYGGLAELSRAAGGRMAAPIPTALIQPELGQLNGQGEGRLGDYLFRTWLPSRDGTGIGELWGGFGAAQIDPDLAEDYWCVYAWPESGNGPVYFVSQDGRVLSTSGSRYVGPGRGPDVGAALRAGDLKQMIAIAAGGSTGLDGRTWSVVSD